MLIKTHSDNVLYLSIPVVSFLVIAGAPASFTNKVTRYYLFLFLLSVDIIVGKDQVADGEGEYRNWDGNTVEQGPGDLPVVQLGDDDPRL